MESLVQNNSLKVAAPGTMPVGYRSRLAQGHVVPGTVETRPLLRADGWESEADGLISMGYLVTLADVD